MAAMMSREIRLASRPKGIPTAESFALARTELEPLQDQQVLVRNLVEVKASDVVFYCFRLAGAPG
jgi:NADPH-dependent curcumin reductase CurA